MSRPSAKHNLYTIGYTSYALHDFIHVLSQFNISALVDVRSSPFSKYYSDYNVNSLKAQLNSKNIYYIPMGDELGARQSSSVVYVNGYADYKLIAQLPTFQQGLARIAAGLENHTIVLMCAEKDPLTCHRSILICRHLRAIAKICHIWSLSKDSSDANLESHERLESRLLSKFGMDHLDMLKSKEQALEEAYDLQGVEIAYKGEGNDFNNPEAR